ncbi:MAG: biotin--[acetyl-CoA-carboxylase] ligase [Lachnospiraceae bacterium]|nr:biotin--[acetyl-CoA-carboxylase] ligase [Lachnospiraceae bacterium]
MLKDSGEFLSGQELSEKLGVSRTAVWNMIGKLREEGYQIEAVTNRGYRLVSAQDSDILNEAEIGSALRGVSWAGRNFVFKKETGSTNEDVMQYAGEGAPEGTLVIAGRQSHGKGRRGRTWISPQDGNVYMSLLLKPDYEPQQAPMVTLVAAMAVCAGMRRQGGEFYIKWPNDVVLRVKENGKDSYKKVAGILTEMVMEDAEIRSVVIGIGLNVNMKQIDEEIAETATSLYLGLHRTVNRAQLIGDIWKSFEEYYEEFKNAKDLAPLRERYEAALVNRGRKVRVLDPREPFEGTARGIDESGSLLVETRDKKLRAVSAGEVSVRGIMGYV